MLPRLLSLAVGLVALSAAGSAFAESKLRSEVIWVDPVLDLAPDIAAAPGDISSILFVNRCAEGCVVVPGPNDARNNTSSIIPSTSTLSAFEHGDEAFDATIECLREVYRPYNVEIVTDDPGPVAHHEAILAGTSDQLGFPANVGGVAPASCSPLDNVISFSFANTLGSSVTELCWTVAQESAHSFGLPNHVRDCSDPMTYIPACGTKYFRDVGLQCGDFEPEECRCTGGQIQNSHRTLNEVFGPGDPLPPPVINITRPFDDTTVIDGFAVEFAVTDPRAGDHVYMYINGTLYGDREAWPIEQSGAAYRFVVPELPDGYLTIEVRARGELGNEGTTALRVLKGEPCTGDGQCLDGQTCEQGGCAFEAADRALGDECDDGKQCFTGLCPSKGGNNFCSEFCDPADAFSCREGFECLAVDDTGVCWPDDAVDQSGGCCDVSGSTRVPPLGTILLIGLVAFMIGRRRRESV